MFNRYIVVPLVVWAIAQFLKFVIAAAGGRVDFRYLYGSGGMPSVHSAVVTSLAVTALLVDGIHSAIFGLSAIFAAIVMYDSFGVRRSAGEQAMAINQIIESLELDHLDHPNLRLREILGHKPREVTVGAILGLVLGCLFNYDKLGSLINLATQKVDIGLVYALAVIALVLLVGGIGARIVLLRRYRSVQLVRSAVSRLSWLAITAGVIGLLLAFMQYEKLTVALWILWPFLYALLVAGAAIAIWQPFRGGALSAALAERQADAEKARWFEGPNKRRRAARARRR